MIRGRRFLRAPRPPGFLGFQQHISCGLIIRRSEYSLYAYRGVIFGCVWAVSGPSISHARRKVCIATPSPVLGDGPSLGALLSGCVALFSFFRHYEGRFRICVVVLVVMFLIALFQLIVVFAVPLLLGRAHPMGRLFCAAAFPVGISGLC